MKRIFITIALFGVIFSANLWAHHAAEGIISDELWNMIDQNLINADSPHLDLDLVMLDTDDTMNTATVDMDPVTGDMYMVTTAVLTFDDSIPEDEYQDYVDEFMSEVVETSATWAKKVPSGTLGDQTSELFFEVAYIDIEPADGAIDYAEIVMYEPIGNGKSQSSIVKATPPGKRAGGK